MVKNVLVIGLLVLVGLSSYSSKGQSLTAHHSLTTFDVRQQHWADSVYESLSWNERIAQLFMVVAYADSNISHHKNLRRLVRTTKVGGLILMQGSPERQAKLSNQLQCVAEVPLLIGMDLACGLNTQPDNTFQYPNQFMLAAVSDDTLIYQMGADIAQQMKTMGVHLSFVPVADTNSNADKLVIGDRLFGEDTHRITQKVVQYMRGLQDHGVLACAQYFSGHGDTQTGAHQMLPVVKHSDQQLFKNKMGFEGLIIADVLNTKGIPRTLPPGKSQVAAFLAGSDLLLFSEEVSVAIKALRKAMRKHRIKRKNLELNVKKILMAKYKAGLANYQPVNTDNLTLKLHQPESEILQYKLYQSAITVVKNGNELLPFHLIDTITFASLSLNEPAPIFHQRLGRYAKFSAFDNVGNKAPQSLIDQLKEFEVVVVGVFGMNNSPEKSYGLKKQDIALIETLSKHTKVILTLFGNPYTLSNFEKLNHVICAYENNDYTQSLVPQALFGAIDVTGSLPISTENSFTKEIGISLNNIQRLGYVSAEMVQMDSRILNKIDLIAQEAIENMATPGCQVLVARHGKIILDKSYGYHTYDSLRLVTSESIYDLASVTKVAASLQAVIFMEEQGLIDLDKKISFYLTDLKGSNKEQMTIRDILSHQAGLWPSLPFWHQTMNSEEYLPEYYRHKSENEFPYFVAEGLYSSKNIYESVWQWVVASRVRDKKEDTPYSYKYSDMGYYMIFRLAEKVLNQPIEDFLSQNIYEPLGLTTLGYNPLNRFSKNRITPTECDSIFRMSQIRGTVHDQGAALLGGVAGHAGLFSNATDLATLMQMHLQGGTYGGQRYFNQSTLDKFTRRQYHNDNRRGAGWDKPQIGVWYGPTSQYASSQTYGHSGFTGTCVWIDPAFDLIFVFLSNRIYPDANNRKLIENNIRTRIQDLVYQSIWEYGKYH